MRVAVLSDIHGNLPALEAVEDDLARTSPDAVLVAGDLVTGAPWSDQVVARVMDRGWPAVRGNHEEYVLRYDTGQGPDWLRGDRGGPVRWTVVRLADSQRRWLSGLPLLARAPGAQVAFVHGSPRDAREGIYPDADDGQLARLFREVPEPVLACGHTHQPCLRRWQDRLLANGGSAGLPVNGDPRATYLLLEQRPGAEWEAAVRQVPYDLDGALSAFARSGYLENAGPMARLYYLELKTSRYQIAPFLRWWRGAGAGLPLGRAVARFAAAAG